MCNVFIASLICCTTEPTFCYLRSTKQLICDMSSVGHTLPLSPVLSPTASNMEAEDPEEYEVEKIVDERVKYSNNEKEYFIKWVGYPSSDNTWELESKIAACTEALGKWEKTKARKRSGVQVQPLQSLVIKAVKVEESPNCLEDFSSSVGEGETASSKKVTFAESFTSTSPIAGGFGEEFGSALDALKERAIQKDKEVEEELQRKVWEAEQPLRKEIADLKAKNEKMLTSMQQLDLFMRHRKDPVETKELMMKNSELSGKLTRAEDKLEVLNLMVKDQEERLDEVDTTLSKVATLFSSVLGFAVTSKSVLRVLPLVEDKIRSQDRQ